MKFKKSIISFDLETTGLDLENDKIVQIGFVKINPNGTINNKSRLINPEIEIPKEASDIHGITNEQTKDAPVFKKIAKSLYRILSKADLTGYNVKRFDVPFLSKEFERCGITWPSNDTKIIDPYLIFKQQEKYTLENAALFYTGEIIENVHDALSDAKAAFDVLLAQSEKYKKDSIEELIELEKDPSWIDSEGKVKWDGDDIAILNFGKHAGKSLNEIDKSYFEWILKQDFLDDFKDICSKAINHEYPKKESKEALINSIEQKNKQKFLPTKDRKCCLCGPLQKDKGELLIRASGYTFDGFVHKSCLEIYDKAKFIWYDFHYKKDIKLSTFDHVLAAVGTPSGEHLGREWDIHSKEFSVCNHIWLECGSLVRGIDKERNND